MKVIMKLKIRKLIKIIELSRKNTINKDKKLNNEKHKEFYRKNLVGVIIILAIIISPLIYVISSILTPNNYNA